MTDLMTRARPARPQRQEPQAPKRTGRWDIQGLRAFAVVAVVLDHLFQWPRGGFVGVDVFFVISGFLITGLLVREHGKTGRISWTGFYKRRFKRIMPAATLVLVVTVIASYLTFTSSRAASIRTDSVWALLFGGNWRMMALSTDYFNADGTSPLQHYWSLSIEEQFYFVWPWLMLLLFVLLRRQARRTAEIVIGAVLATIVAASFAWAVAETSSDASRAYFDTFARVWELGVGALLALCVPLLMRIPDAVRPLLAWIGLGGMVASLWVIDSESGFPAPAAALPVLATALVIAAGTFADHRRQQRFLFPLTNRVSGYIGDISYSLYLWHFPVIIIGIALIGDSASDKTALLVTMLAISIYSYHLVEDPLRRATWTLRRGRRRGHHDVSDAYKYTALSAAVLVVAVMCAAALRMPEPPESALSALGGPVATDEASSGPAPAVPAGPRTTALQAEIESALGVTSWPDDLDPTIDEAIKSRQATPEINACAGPGPTNRAACTFGSPTATRTAVLVGDSVSVTYAGVLRQAMSSYPDWRLMVYGSYGCAFTEAYIGNPDPELQEACPDRKAAAVAAIRQIKPDILFISNAYAPRVPVGESAALTESAWSESTAAILASLGGSVDKVAFLAAPPGEKSPSECYTRASTPTDCASKVSSAWTARAATEQQLAEQVGGVWVDSRGWFCFQEICPAFVDTTPVKIDAVHMTQAYGTKIAPAAAEALGELMAAPAAR